MHLLFCFVEPPSSLTWRGVRLGPSHLGAAGVEMACLCLYSFHAAMQYRAYGSGWMGFWRSPWRTAKVFVLAVCFIDVIISAARNLDTPGVHLSQLFRVFFVLEQSGRMRQLCSCIVKSLPAIISIMFLCFVHIFVFGVIGFLFVGPLEEPDPLHLEDAKLYFDTLGKSFLSCFVLLTSENFPEVMLPSYRKSWWVSLYFIAFVIIGLYMLLQLTTAVVFHSFQLHTKDKLAHALAYRERALQACFTLLSEFECGEGTIPLRSWQKLMKIMRPDWGDVQAEILFQAATGRDNSDDAATTSGVAAASSSPGSSVSSDDDPVGIDFIQFEQIIRFSQKSFNFADAMPNGGGTAAAAAAGLSDVDVSMASVRAPPPTWGPHVGGGAGGDDSALPSAASSSPSGPASPSRVGAATVSLPATPVRPHHSSASVNSSGSFPVSVASDSDGNNDGIAASGDANNWNGVVPACVTDHPWVASLARLLLWYFTLRVPIPYLIRVHVMGRKDKQIKQREEDERPVDLRAPALTPLHPNHSLREQLTTFSLSELVSDLLTAIHACLLVLRMFLENDIGGHSDTSGRDAIEGLTLMLQVQFLLEIVSKAWLCRGRFFNARMHIVDTLAIAAVWIAEVVWLGKNRGVARDAVSCIRLVRCLRLYHRLNSFTLLLEVLSQVGPALVALFGVLFILLYSYSIIAMVKKKMRQKQQWRYAFFVFVCCAKLIHFFPFCLCRMCLCRADVFRRRVDFGQLESFLGLRSSEFLHIEFQRLGALAHCTLLSIGGQEKQARGRMQATVRLR
jgi:hypothetical protein